MPLRNCARTIPPASDDYTLTRSGPLGHLKPSCRCGTAPEPNPSLHAIPAWAGTCSGGKHGGTAPEPCPRPRTVTPSREVGRWGVSDHWAAAELRLNQTQACTRYPLGLGHALAENMGRAAIHERYTAGFIKRRLGVDWLGVWDRVTKVARRSHNVAILAGCRQIARQWRSTIPGRFFRGRRLSGSPLYAWW